jgi:hypothetical protein
MVNSSCVTETKGTALYRSQKLHSTYLERALVYRSWPAANSMMAVMMAVAIAIMAPHCTHQMLVLSSTASRSGRQDRSQRWPVTLGQQCRRSCDARGHTVLQSYSFGGQAHWVVWPAEALVGQQLHALGEHVDEAGGNHDAAAEAARGSEGEAAGAQRLDAPTEQWQQHPCR